MCGVGVKVSDGGVAFFKLKLEIQAAFDVHIKGGKKLFMIKVREGGCKKIEAGEVYPGPRI